MEVDILSPQMCVRSVSSSHKRVRSPESSSALERAPKRPMVFQMETASHISLNAAVNQEVAVCGRRRSLHEDEWVYQTRGMTIRSPGLVDPAATATEPVQNRVVASLAEDSRGDIHMCGPDDISRHDPHLEPPSTTFATTQSRVIEEGDTSMTSPINSQINSPSLSLLQTTTTAAAGASQLPASLDLPAQNAVLNSLHSLLDNTQHQDQGQHTRSALAPPRITLHPATPSTPSNGCRLSYMSHPLSVSQPSTPPPLNLNATSEMSMSVVGEHVTSSSSSSSTSSSASASLSDPSHWANHHHQHCEQTPSQVPSQRKKPLVSMGPRADCEKCRSKVPGHWMHFD